MGKGTEVEKGRKGRDEGGIPWFLLSPRYKILENTGHKREGRVREIGNGREERGRRESGRKREGEEMLQGSMPALFSLPALEKGQQQHDNRNYIRNLL